MEKPSFNPAEVCEGVTDGAWDRPQQSQPSQSIPEQSEEKYKEDEITAQIAL